MHAGTALLTVFLAGPALAAPPAVPSAGAADNAAPAAPASTPAVIRKPAPAPSPVTPPGEGSHRAKMVRFAVSGGLLLGAATVLTLGVVAVRIHRSHAGDELAGIRTEVEAAGGKTLAQGQRITELKQIDTWTRNATIGLSLSAVAVAALGAGLIAAAARHQRLERARLALYGGPEGAGIVLLGRF